MWATYQSKCTDCIGGGEGADIQGASNFFFFLFVFCLLEDRQLELKQK